MDIIRERVKKLKNFDIQTIKTLRTKTISEARSEIEIDPDINLVDTGSKNEIKVPAILQLQPQNVTTTPQQQHNDLLSEKLKIN